MDDSNKQHDAIQEAFLNNIFLLFTYKTYTPGEVIINFRSFHVTNPGAHLGISTVERLGVANPSL